MFENVNSNCLHFPFPRSLIDRCEDDEAVSLRIKCGDFCRGLYNNIFASESASHTSSYLLAAMVDLHADKLEIEGSNMTAAERDEELEKAKKVPYAIFFVFRHRCFIILSTHSFVRPWPLKST